MVFVATFLYLLCTICEWKWIVFSMFFSPWKTSLSVWNKTIHSFPFHKHKEKKWGNTFASLHQVHIAFCSQSQSFHVFSLYIYIYVLFVEISLWSFETEVQAIRIETEEKSFNSFYTHFVLTLQRFSSLHPKGLSNGVAKSRRNTITVLSEEIKQLNSGDTPLIPPLVSEAPGQRSDNISACFWTCLLSRRAHSSR